jgi:hypothetical protein
MWSFIASIEICRTNNVFCQLLIWMWSLFVLSGQDALVPLLASQNVISRNQVARFERLKMSFGEFKWWALGISKCHLANSSGAL